MFFILCSCILKCPNIWVCNIYALVMLCDVVFDPYETVLCCGGEITPPGLGGGTVRDDALK